MNDEIYVYGGSPYGMSIKCPSVSGETVEALEKRLAAAKERDKAAHEAKVERERIAAEAKAAHALGLRALNDLAVETRPEFADARLKAAKALMEYGASK